MLNLNLQLMKKLTTVVSFMESQSLHTYSHMIEKWLCGITIQC